MVSVRSCYAMASLSTLSVEYIDVPAEQSWLAASRASRSQTARLPGSIETSRSPDPAQETREVRSPPGLVLSQAAMKRIASTRSEMEESA
jgi:hypothetical protein